MQPRRRDASIYDPLVDLPFARWRGVDRLALGLVLLAVWSSTLPWFGRSVGSSEGRTAHFDANAWQASARWSVAIVVTALAGIVWLGLRMAGRADRWTGAASAVAIGCAIWLSVSRWVSIPGPGGPITTVTQLRLVVAFPAQLYGVHRDRLNIAHYCGYSADVRYGLYIGLVLMSALLLVILVASTRPRVPELPWLSG
jgi:hypothetical protein